MKRPSIKLSLISVLALIAGSSAVMGYVSISGLERTNRATSDIASNWLPSVEKSQQILAEMVFLRLAYRDRLIFGDEDTISRQEAIIDERSEKLRAEIDKYAALSHDKSSSADEKQLIANLRTSANEYIASSSSFLEASRRHDYEAAKQALIASKPSADKVAELVTSLVALNRDGSARASSLSAQAFERTKIIAFSTLGFLAVILVFAVVFITKGVATPISCITGAMRRLADGDTTTAVPYAGRADEIGHMAAAVSVFREAAISNRRLEDEAEEARNQAETDRQVAQEKAEADAAERLRVATSGLAAGLTRLAGGDLTCELLEPFSADFEALRHDFNRSVSQLSTTLLEVKGAIVTIDGGTREIAAGADDLSKRTEQQAASLEETSAALDQITVNVSNSTKRSEEARVVATNANHSAKLSADVVSQAEQAMTKIEDSSQQISNIIGVIDEIAFQTNLLALNAGVEAARAGEAGKGFAVVAQEVRELAQRSANAAKDIKTLIQTSTSEVHSGVKLVRNTAGSLRTIGALIIEMNGHMDAIAISAREQSTGLGEINTAMNQMDQSTQQNAAMVEQSTAAANTLAQEAGRLRDLVGKFQLKGATTSPAQTKPVAIVPIIKAVPSPARALGKTIATAFSGNTALSSKPSDWEEF